MKRSHFSPLLFLVVLTLGCGKSEYDRRLQESMTRLGASEDSNEERPTSPDEAFAALVAKGCRFYDTSTGIAEMTLDAARSANQITEYTEEANYDVLVDSMRDEDTEMLRVIRSQVNGVWLAGDIGDAAAAHVISLRGMSWLSLESTQVTDDGLRNLGDLSSVARLSMMNNPNLTNDVLEYVLAMENIKHVILAGEFTDDGVQELSNHPDIEEITLYGGDGITQASVDYLRQELPDSTITLK